MGLKLWKHGQDRQTAEDYINKFDLAGLAKVRPVLFGPYKKEDRIDKSQTCRKAGTQSHGSKAVYTQS
jgi:hypothetical protein